MGVVFSQDAAKRIIRSTLADERGGPVPARRTKRQPVIRGGGVVLAVVQTPSNVVAAAATNAVQWTVEAKDTSTMVDLGAHNTRITAKQAGWFRCMYSVTGDNATGLLDDGINLWVAINGGGPEEGSDCRLHGHNIGNAIDGGVGFFIELATNDYIELYLNVESATQQYTPGGGQMSLEYVTSS